MKRVRVTFTAHGREAEVHPMYGVLANASFVERATALGWNYTGDALGILHYVEGDATAFDAAATAVDPVLEHVLAPAGEDAFYAYVRDATTEGLADLFGPLTHGGVVVVPPIVYREDGRVALTVVGPSEEVQAAYEAVAPPVDVEVEAVGGLRGLAPAAEARLSDRQREALEAGLALGYYDVPRAASVADVAAALDCADSTAAEHLRKAEATLVRSVLRSG